MMIGDEHDDKLYWQAWRLIERMEENGTFKIPPDRLH